MSFGVDEGIYLQKLSESCSGRKIYKACLNSETYCSRLTYKSDENIATQLEIFAEQEISSKIEARNYSSKANSRFLIGWYPSVTEYN